MTDKAPDFIRHTCPFRDECWAEVDSRSLGADIRDPDRAQKARIKHRLPSATRPHPCGFEATRLEFCPKYRQWAQEQDEPEEESEQLVFALAL